MGGLLHLFDFHYLYLGRKHKKQGDAGVGVEAPRNSFELTTEPLQNQCSGKDGDQVDLLKSNDCPIDDTLKKLVCDDISKQSNNKQNAPSIVAKLMGIDEPAVDNRPEVPSAEDKKEKTDATVKEIQHVEKASTVRTPKLSKSSSKKQQRSYKDAYFRYWGNGINLGKPRPRVHPQEKELQKFKKDFEAWQAARFLECARVVELGNIPEQWLAQLDLTKEKMSLYENSRKTVVQKPVEHKRDRLKSRSLRSVDSEYKLPAEHKESYCFSGRSSGRNFEHMSLPDSDLTSERYSAPTKIVILKPGPDSFSTANDDSWITSTCSIEDADCIEDLLEEVKARLKCEMLGKTSRTGSRIRRAGIETPKEKSVYTKLTYQPAARENTRRNSSSSRLLRSESARSYRTESLINEVAPSSPKFVSRDTRNLLSERLRNVLDGENQQNHRDMSDDFCREPFFDDARARLEQARDILNADTGSNYWRDNYEDTRGRSFRHEVYDDENCQEQPSPRNLVRSLSAPVSGTSFGKLLLEDRHISPGAQIKRKHEAIENSSIDCKSQRNGGFNIRDRVSNITSSLTLRKKLFTRKLQSIDSSEIKECDSPRGMMDEPRILPVLRDRNENLTEVPPSPASVCSSAHEEFWRPTDNPSPISVSDVTSVGDQSVGNVFREISSNLTELRKQLNQLDYEGSEITSVTEDPSEAEAEAEVEAEAETFDVEDEAEAYIRSLLTTSGLYDGSWVKSFSRWDPYVKPMSNWVFEKVEESYSKQDNEDEQIDYDERTMGHKLLFDMSNEALSLILGPPRTLSKFRRKITDVTMLPVPQGRKLVQQVWDMIQEYLEASMDQASYSLEDLMDHAMDITPWSNLVDEEMSALGKELEYQITGELVDELVKDMHF